MEYYSWSSVHGMTKDPAGNWVVREDLKMLRAQLNRAMEVLATLEYRNKPCPDKQQTQRCEGILPPKKYADCRECWWEEQIKEGK